MTFDKDAYRRRRKAGKRGQGDDIEYPKPKFLVNRETGKWIGKKRPKHERDAGIEIDEWDRGKNMVRTRSGFDMINRKQARQKHRDTTVEGKPYTAKGVKPNPQKKEKFTLTLDPTMSNHTRLKIRDQRREMIREDQRKERENAKDQGSIQA